MPQDKPAPKVITADVAGSASDATIALNEPPAPEPSELTFCVREDIHHRIIGRGRQTLVEYVRTMGEIPEDYPRFQGVGELHYQHDGHHGQRTFRFTVPGKNIEEAWSHYDGYADRGSAQARQQLQDEYAAAVKAQATPSLVRATEADLKGIPRPGKLHLPGH